LPLDASAQYPYDVVESGHVGTLRDAATTKLDPSFETKFDRIGPGECAAVAYAQLGTPVLQGKDIPTELILKNTFEQKYGAQNIDQYLVWQNSDKYFCIGFAGTGEAISKFQGTLPSTKSD